MTKAAQTYDYDTLRIPLVGNHHNREASVTKDQIFYNVVVDIIKTPLSNTYTETQRPFINKRGGFTANTTVFASGGTGRGMYYWSRSGKTYSVVATKVYSNTTEIATLTTSSGSVYFYEATGTTDYLMVSDGTKLYTITTTDTWAEVTDGDLPAGNTTPVSLDGYVFVIKAGTDEIYNSDVDAPTAWTASSFISAEMYPDNLVALARQVNYVVAFGSYSTEFLYDNENASGSPLARNQSIAIKTGLAAIDSIGQADRRLVFVGQSNIGDPGVWMFDGLTPSRISTEFIDKILYNEGSALSTAKAWICKHKGHVLYVLNLSSASRTLVYDLDEKLWFDWSSNSGGSHVVLPYNYATQGANNIVLVQHTSDGKLYKLDPTIYTDDAGAILVKIVTGRLDFGNAMQKRIFRAELIADIQSSGTVTFDWTNDDYTTWSSSRSLDLTTRPYTKALGVLRRPAFRFLHSANAAFRIEAIEFDFSAGVH
jgi:hypothetical protein